MFSEGESYAATQVLKTVIQSGTGTAANYGCPAAGKTGTTSSFTDAYFDGYTPKLATAVWVGYPNDDPMSMANWLRRHAGGADLARLHVGGQRRLSAATSRCPPIPWHGTAVRRELLGREGAEPVEQLGIKRRDRPERPPARAAPASARAAIRRTTRRCSPSRRSRRPVTEAGNGNGRGHGNGGGHGGGASDRRGGTEQTLSDW